jgi:hypothetical protein
MQNSIKPSAHEQKFKVRDERKPGHHWADNEVLDIFARKIGLDGYAVYMYLGRHSNNQTGRCTKSLAEIAAAFKTSTDTVYRAIKKLMAHSLVAKYEVVGKASVYVLIEVPKKSTPTAHSGEYPPRTAATPTANSGDHPPRTAATPTANSGDHLPHTAVTPPLIAVTPPHTAVPNKEVRLFQDFSQDLNHGDCAQSALLPLASESEKPAEPKDAREAGLFAAIRSTHPLCDIDGWDVKVIRGYLKRKPAFPGAVLEMCIAFRSLSEGENLSLPVRKWIGDVDKYQAGPLNKYGDPQYSAEALQGLRSQARTILYGQQPEQLSLKPATGATALPSDFDRSTSAKELWPQVLMQLENAISRHSFDTWLKPTRGIGRRGDVFYVEVPNREFSQVDQKYGDLIRAEIGSAGITEVKFLTSDELASHNWERTA